MQDLITLVKSVKRLCERKSVDCRNCEFKYYDKSGFRLCAWNTIPSDLNINQIEYMLHTAELEGEKL